MLPAKVADRSNFYWLHWNSQDTANEEFANFHTQYPSQRGLHGPRVLSDKYRGTNYEQRIGRSIRGKELHWKFICAAYHAYGQGVLPDNAGFFTPPSVQTDVWTASHRNYLFGMSRFTYRLTIFTLPWEIGDHSEGNNEPSDWDVWHTHNTGEYPDYPVATAFTPYENLANINILMDKTYDTDNAHTQITDSGCIDLKNLKIEYSTMQEGLGMGGKNHIYAAVAGTAFNQKGEQSFSSRFPFAHLNTRLVFTDK